MKEINSKKNLVSKEEVLSGVIKLAHGNGGKLMQELIQNVFMAHFDNPWLKNLSDGAYLKFGEQELVFSTDSYVIRPAFFPGGDIGRLAVAGTVNDLSVMGAKPLYLSAGFIIEEGFKLEELKKIVQSMQQTAAEVGIYIVTGDTKVVEKGSADGIFINTCGIGQITSSLIFSPQKVKPGDKIILSGRLGEHAIAVMLARGELPLELSLKSDVAPLWSLVEKLINTVGAEPIKLMRDPTRGGLATLLNEFCTLTKHSLEIEEQTIPISDEIRTVCELTGFDPLYLANEGKIVLLCEPTAATKILEVMQTHPLGVKSAIIGQVSSDPLRKVYCRTLSGGERILDPLFQDMLPRIC